MEPTELVVKTIVRGWTGLFDLGGDSASAADHNNYPTADPVTGTNDNAAKHQHCRYDLSYTPDSDYFMSDSPMWRRCVTTHERHAIVESGRSHRNCSTIRQ